MLHIPLRNYLDAEASTNLTNVKELFALFEGRRFTVSFSGHTHTTEHHYFDAADGWKGEGAHHHHVMTAVSGSWWSGPFDHRGVACADSRDGSPNGFHILSIDGVSYKTRFVPAKEPNGRQIRLSVDSRFHSARYEVQREFRQGQLLGSPIAHAAVGATAIIANVFDGGPKTKVAMTDRRPRRDRNDPADHARPVRRGSVRAQRGDQEALDQGGAVVAHVDRPPARRSRAGNASRGRRGGH